MIYAYCTACQVRIEYCSNANSHKAQRLTSYRADFMLGGRYGKRIRKLFATKKDAESFEYVTQADFKRGTFLPQEKTNKTVEEFFKEYIETIVNRYMKGSQVEGYRLAHFIKKFSIRPLHTLQAADLERYITERLNEGKLQTTINRELTGIKTAFKWAVEKEYLRTSPFASIKKFKIEAVRVRWLDQIEIERLIKSCITLDDLDMRDIILLTVNTGFRKSNLEKVTAHDISNNRINAVRTKSGKPYDVPINVTLADLLSRIVSMRPTGPLLNFSNFRKRWDSIVKDARLWKPRNDPGAVTLHTLRHTFAAQCLKKGIPLDRVCKWLGHHSMEFTRTHYGHLCPNQEQSEINLLNLGSTKDQALLGPVSERGPAPLLRSNKSL